MITFGSLFAGIGGFDLGFERAGMECKWQVEIDDYATRVLEKHWPNVRRWRDVRTFPPKPVDDWRVDVICGGFPCQDISYAGLGAGIDGARSGLFFDALRVACELRPRVLVLENVAALLFRGLDRVLGTLAAFGFDAEWHCIPAANIGAPHGRDRSFVVAYPTGVGWFRGAVLRNEHCTERIGPVSAKWGTNRQAIEIRLASASFCERWVPEPGTIGTSKRVPHWVDRLKGVGNAVVPQVAEWIGKRIVEAMGNGR